MESVSPPPRLISSPPGSDPDRELFPVFQHLPSIMDLSGYQVDMVAIFAGPELFDDSRLLR